MNSINPVNMAEGFTQWKNGRYTTITFCVTEDCNLACKYCYMVGKNNKRKMTFETAKKIVDYVLESSLDNYEDAVSWDFIGGEPLLEMELIDKISDYIVAKSYILNHRWFHCHSFSFSTNGILYGSELIRKYIQKHYGHVWFGLSVDGTKIKHDRARVYKDGRGSYDDVAKNIPLWLSEFPGASTKATFSSDDLPYLKDSVIHLWDLGIHEVMANIVYEDVWKEGDVELFESQLKELADYIIDHQLWDKYKVAFFDVNTGLPVCREDLYKNRCGAGYKSLAFDCEGNIYPCIRFLDMCFPNKDKIIIGNIDTGINKDYLRSFAALDWISQSPAECNNCEYGSNCGWCEAYNFQESTNDTIFERTTYLCEMNKVNAKITDYLWRRYAEETGRTSPRAIVKASRTESKALRYIQFVLADDITPHCSYTTKSAGEIHKMSDEIVSAGLTYCHNHDLLPIFLDKTNHGLRKGKNVYYEIIDANRMGAGQIDSDVIEVLKPGYIVKVESRVANYIIQKENIHQIYDDLKCFYSTKYRINLFISDLDSWSESDIADYRSALIKVNQIIIDNYKNKRKIQLNVLTDRLNLIRPRDCGAGVSTVALAPNGKFYICPGFYFTDEKNFIGDIVNGIDEKKLRLCQREYSSVCRNCSITSCTRCLLLNKQSTREINTPGENQCKIQIANTEVSLMLRNKLLEKDLVMNKDMLYFTVPDYNDPLKWESVRKGV